MARILRFLTVLACLTAAAPSLCQVRQEGQATKTHGLIEHILKNGRSLTITYYPISHMQPYIDQVLIEKKKPDIKTGNKTSQVTITMTSAEQVDQLLTAIQKEAYRIIVFTVRDSTACSLYRLDPQYFGTRKFETTTIQVLEPRS